MNKAKNGIVRVGQTVRLHHPEDQNIYEDFIVAAVNPILPKDDIRVVPVKALFALRAVTAKNLVILEDDDAPTAEQIAAQKVADQTGKPPAIQPGTQELTASAPSPEVVAPVVTQAAAPVAAQEPEKLREDGPSLEQYVKAGYDAAGYPPKGYAAKNSPGWQKLKKEREDAAKKLADEAAKA